MDIYYCIYIALQLPMLSAVSVYSGATVSFNCTLTPEGNDTIIWEYTAPDTHRVIALGTQKTNIYAVDPRFTVTSDNGTTVFTVEDVTLEDEGLYQCATFFKESVLFWLLEIYILPEEPVIVQNFAASQGEIYIVECLVEGGKPLPQFSWSLIDADGRSIDLPYAAMDTLPSPYNNGTGLTSVRLGLTLTRQTQGASVLCNAYQPGLEAYYNHTTTELITNAMYAPCDPVVRANETLTEGEGYWLRCSADCANPAANISCSLVYKSHEEVLNISTQSYFSSGTFYRTDSEVYVQATREMHGAVIKCAAVNSVVIQQQMDLPYATASLDIDYRPVMMINDAVLYAEEGSDITVQCLVADAKPLVTQIEWLRDGVVVDVLSDSRYKVEKFSSAANLIISNVNRTDEGQWHCRGLNAVGAGISEPSLLHVFYKPVCVPGPNYRAALGEEVKLVCMVTAKPAEVHFQWRKSGVNLEIQLVNRKVGAFVAESSIKIVPRQQSDYGTYECYAENAYGSQEDPCTIELLLPGPAEAPSNCRVAASALTGLLVTCTTVPGDSSVVTYTLKMLQDGEYVVLFNQSIPTFNVTGLTENKNYSFTVCASNYVYWMERACTALFNGTTAKQYELNTRAQLLTSPMPSVIAVISSETLYIIIAAACAGVVVISIVVGVCCYLHSSKNSSSGDVKAKSDTLAMEF